MTDHETCGTLSSRPDVRGYSEPEECSGCLRSSGHYGPHLFKNGEGEHICWEIDRECNCEGCKSDEADDWCIVYWRVESMDELTKLISEKE